MAKDYVILTVGIRAVKNSIKNVSIFNHNSTDIHNIPTMIIDYFDKESEEINYSYADKGYEKLHSDLAAIIAAMEGSYEVSPEVDPIFGKADEHLNPYDLVTDLRSHSSVYYEELELPEPEAKE